VKSWRPGLQRNFPDCQWLIYMFPPKFYFSSSDDGKF